MRKITIDFSLDNPIRYGRFLGYRGEHKATEVNIVPPNCMKDNSNVQFYKVVFGFECGRPYCSDNLYMNESRESIDFLIPIEVTSHPIVSLQLEGHDYKGDLILKSESIMGLVFEPSVFVEKVEDIYVTENKTAEALTTEEIDELTV